MSSRSSGGTTRSNSLNGGSRSGRHGDETMHFAITKHSKQILDVMHTLRVGKKLCDITLRVGEDEIYAHKIVLAAASPYFRGMFTTGMKEERMNSVSMGSIRPCTLGVLIDFAYTSEISINRRNVQHLLPGAVMLGMNSVIESCCVFLERQLDPNNAIEIADFAGELGCTDLQKKAMDFIFQHFADVAESEDFVKLNAEQLRRIIDCDNLNVQCESLVYDSVCRWVHYDQKARIDYMMSLLQSVRCHYLPPKYIDDKVKHCKLLQNNKKVAEYVRRVLAEITSVRPTRCLSKPRKSCTPTIIYVAGGYFRRSLSTFESFCPVSTEWKNLNVLPVPRSGLGMCVVYGRFFAVGGRRTGNDGNQDCPNLDFYDLPTNSWHVAPPMSVPRGRVGVGVIDWMIYAVGGSNGATYHNSVERYDVETEEWALVAPMRTRRIGVGVTTINHILYAAGGYDGVNRLRSVEAYDSNRNEWRYLSSMNTARSGAGVVAMNEVVYAVGGFDGDSQLRSVERYHPETNSWDFIAPMNSPRSALGVAVLNGKLYALGGFDGEEFLASIEVYDPQLNKWELIGEMTCGRSGHAVTVGSEPC